MQNIYRNDHQGCRKRNLVELTPPGSLCQWYEHSKSKEDWRRLLNKKEHETLSVEKTELFTGKLQKQSWWISSGYWTEPAWKAWTNSWSSGTWGCTHKTLTATVFSIMSYSWTVKKDRKEFKLWCWWRFLCLYWTASNVIIAANQSKHHHSYRRRTSRWVKRKVSVEDEGHLGNLTRMCCVSVQLHHLYCVRERSHVSHPGHPASLSGCKTWWSSLWRWPW